VFHRGFGLVVFLCAQNSGKEKCPPQVRNMTGQVARSIGLNDNVVSAVDTKLDVVNKPIAFDRTGIRYF